MLKKQAIFFDQIIPHNGQQDFQGCKNRQGLSVLIPSITEIGSS